MPGVPGPSTLPLGDQLGQRRVNVSNSVSHAIDLTGSSPTSELTPTALESGASIEQLLACASAVAPECDATTFAPALRAVGVTDVEKFVNADEWVLRCDVKLLPSTISLMRCTAEDMTSQKKPKVEEL